MPLIEHIALVSLTGEVSTGSLMRAAAAIEKQVTRDFTPVWGISATVNAFEDLDSVPSDYHPVVVFGDSAELMDQLQVEMMIGAQRAARLIDLFESDRLGGLHLNTYTRQPFALVRASDIWTILASHETLEMLADPSGNRLKAARHPLDRRLRVEYLLEICDPCQSTWYPVNGVRVSDFYTPSYFDPVFTESGRYSFTGELEHPLDVLEGGYLTWLDPRDSALYQLQGREPGTVLLVDLAELAATIKPLRTLVDEDPQTPQIDPASLSPATRAVAADSSFEAVGAASEGSALRIREAVWSLAVGDD